MSWDVGPSCGAQDSVVGRTGATEHLPPDGGSLRHRRLLGSVLNDTYRHAYATSAFPEQIAAKAQDSLVAALHMGPDVAAFARDAFVDGHQAGLLVAACAVAVTAGIVIVLMGVADRRTPPPNDDRDASRSHTDATTAAQA